MRGINGKIDAHVKKERRKFLIASALGAIIIIPVTAWVFLPPLGATSQTTGIVTRMIGLPTDEEQSLYLLVELDDKTKVRSFIPDSSLYRKGQKVKLEKVEPLIFGRAIYRFCGYEEGV